MTLNYTVGQHVEILTPAGLWIHGTVVAASEPSEDPDCEVEASDGRHTVYPRNGGIRLVVTETPEYAAGYVAGKAAGFAAGEAYAWDEIAKAVRIAAKRGAR